MLKSMRKNTKIIIWTVVGSFILWGGFSVGTQFGSPDGGGRLAGKMFGKDVSYQEFNLFYRANQIFSVSQQPIRDPEILKLQTWQSLMLAREAKNQGIKISDQEVKEEIIRILKEAGIENPSGEFYKKWVRSALRESPVDFEAQVREILRIQKFVRQVNDAPLDMPTEDEIKERIFREKNSLALEMKRFKTKEEAETFYSATNDVKAWTALREEAPDDFKNTGKIALDAVINLWGIPKENAEQLLELEVNSISEPQPIREEFAVFLIIDKEKAGEEAYSEEEIKKYEERMIERKKRQRFFEFSADLKQRAELEDYIPSAEPEEDEVETSAAPSETPTQEVVAEEAAADEAASDAKTDEASPEEVLTLN